MSSWEQKMLWGVRHVSVFKSKFATFRTKKRGLKQQDCGFVIDLNLSCKNCAASSHFKHERFTVIGCSLFSLVKELLLKMQLQELE